MSALKLGEKFKVGLITLVLALMLLTEPVLSAGKSGRGGGGGGGGSQKSQQAQPSPSAPRVQPSPSVSTAPSRVTTSAPSVRTEVRSGTSNPPGSGSPPATSMSGNRQPDRRVISSPSAPVAPAPQPRPVTSSPQSSTGGSRHNIREQPTISSSVRTSPVGSSTTEANPSGTPSTSRETNQINPERTHRIGSSIGKENPAAPAVGKQPSVPVTEKQTSVSAGSRTVSDKASRIGSSDSDKKPSASPTATQPVISPSKTLRIGSTIGKEKGGGRVRERRSSSDSSKSASTGEAGPASGPISTESPSVSVDDSSRQVETGRRSNRANSQRILRTDKKSPVSDATGDGRGVHKVDTPEKVQETQDARLRTQGSRQDPGHADRGPADSRLSKRISENQKAIINNNAVTRFDGDKTRIRRDERIGSSHMVYDDCPELVWHSRHHEHIYFDCHRQVCHRAIWPEYYFPVYYGWGPCWTFRYVYPYYHRKYVFVSLGGYWPVEYTYVRYYWYGCHPYIWSGYYPIPYEVQGNTYNYYTYNYYTYNYPSTEVGTTASAGPVETTNYIRPVDENTFADVREKLAKQQAAKPDRETPADAYFEAATKAFEIYDYDTAIEKFARAIEFAPDDMILPFAYAQALLADERYVEAAGVLRAALAKVSPEKEGVFYPRGLYTNDDVLFEQIDRLDEKAKLYSFDADLQLLLGYQLLGIGEIDQAIEPLKLASQDLENATAAAVLLNLLEKVRANSTSQNID